MACLELECHVGDREVMTVENGSPCASPTQPSGSTTTESSETYLSRALCRYKDTRKVTLRVNGQRVGCRLRISRLSL